MHRIPAYGIRARWRQELVQLGQRRRESRDGPDPRTVGPRGCEVGLTWKPPSLRVARVRAPLAVFPIGGPMPRRSLIALSASLIALTVAGTAQAAPPPNDNYLSSSRMVRADGTVAHSFHDSVNTTEATTQTDLFNP